MRLQTCCTLIAILGLLGGCAARQRYGYALPPKADVEGMHADLLSCANEQNISGRELLSRLFINIDADTLLIYNLRAPQDRRMTVRLDHYGLSEADAEREFAAAKQVGDALMACARAKQDER